MSDLAEVRSNDALRQSERSTAYLLGRLQLVEHRIRSLIARRRRARPEAEDPFRGLYLSDEHIDRLLGEDQGSPTVASDDASRITAVEAEGDAEEASGGTIRLRALARRAGLDGRDVDLLLVALAPDLDARFEQLYGYLNDDVSRRRASVGLALELTGTSAWSAAARSRLSSGAPLLSLGLVVIEDPERPFLSRSLKAPDRVTAHLLGDDRPEPIVAELIGTPLAVTTSEDDSNLAAALSNGVRLVYLREQAGASSRATARAALAAANLGSLIIDLDQLAPTSDLAEITMSIGREALLSGTNVVAGPLEAVLDRAPQSIRDFAALPGPVLLHGRAAWEPSWSRVVPLVLDSKQSSTAQRLKHWQQILGATAPPQLETADITTQFNLSNEQIIRAVEAARLQARLDGNEIGINHLRAGARAQNGVGLERLARRIQPAVEWADLVLAVPTLQALREFASRARRRDLVLDTWGMRPGGGRGRGITVLFTGDSGTGKTMSAEVLAHHLGLDLYTVNLATVIDKYIGETEKNLERIFTEADGVNAVLLFDEADALFGKRSEVRDAHDRYANVEVAYLLQRMETFNGLAILATNLRANVDDAFARRLDMVVDFPNPDADMRRALWGRCLNEQVPTADDIDLDFCAAAFELSGGNIRSIAITAAYLAAERGDRVGMADLIQAVQREYRKLGRLVVASEFGKYYELIAR